MKMKSPKAPYIYILIAILALTILVLILPFTKSRQSGDKPPAVSPAALEEPGEQDIITILEKSLKAHGGRDALSSVRSLKMNTSSDLGPEEEEKILEEAFYRFPDQMKSEARIGKDLFVQAYDRGNVWVMEKDSVYQGDMRTAEILRRSLKHFPFFLLQAVDTTSLVLAKDRSFIDGEPYYTVLVIDRDADETTMLISPDTFLLRRMDYPVFAGETEEHLRLDFLDYSETGGVQLPRRVNIFIGGNLVQETKVLTYELNPQLSDSLFEPPGTLKSD